MVSSTNADAPAAASTPQDMRAYRAPSLLQPHRARAALRDAHEGRIPPLMAYFAMLSTPQMIKVVAQMGYDVLMIDYEHSAMGVEAMTNMVHDIQHISEGKTIAWVRVAGHDHDTIGYALDAGASIMVPQVSTVEEARHIVSAAKFGKSINGTRSAPPARWIQGYSDTPLDASLTLWENLNQQAAIIIQVESEAAVRALDAILADPLAGPHIDAVWFGTLDARVSMGLPGFWGAEPEWMELLGVFEETLRKHDKPCAGVALGPDEAKRMAGRGKALVGCAGDVFHLVQEGAKALAEGRGMFPATNISKRNKGEETPEEAGNGVTNGKVEAEV